MEHALIEREELFMTIEGGKKTYTIADIEALPPGERAELIDGEMFIMLLQAINTWITGANSCYIRLQVSGNTGSSIPQKK